MELSDLVVDSTDEALSAVPVIDVFGDARHRSAEPHLRPHYNPGIEICLCRAGVYRWDVGGSIVEIKPGELSLTRPWEEHSGVDNIIGPGRLSWIILPAKRGVGLESLELSDLLGPDACWVLGAVESTSEHFLGELPDAEAAFATVGRELTSGLPGRRAILQAAAATILVSAARRLAGSSDRRAGGADPVPDGVVEVLGTVARSPGAEWTSADMARKAGLGLTAFTEWCRRVTGRSPRWYVLEQRLSQARSLLADSGRSVTDIALETGFASSQHFSASFRKLYGETPSAFRRRSRGD